MARSSSSAQLALPDAKRISALQAFGKHTKTSTIQMLKSLESAGSLGPVGTERQLRSKLQAATEAHSKTVTPYGPVVQPIRLDHPKLRDWDICSPFAWLYHMATISTEFARVMKSCADRGPLRIVIFCDEMIPGNPFRPEKSRTLMCIYWAIVDWPGYLLSRTFAWSPFTPDPLYNEEDSIALIVRLLGWHGNLPCHYDYTYVIKSSSLYMENAF